MNNDENPKRFKSVFLCGVEMHKDHIELIDSSNQVYIVEKTNKAAVDSFVFWFKGVFLKCIPRVLSVIDYDVKKNDGDFMFIVNKIIMNPETFCINVEKSMPFSKE